MFSLKILPLTLSLLISFSLYANERRSLGERAIRTAGQLVNPLAVAAYDLITHKPERCSSDNQGDVEDFGCGGVAGRETTDVIDRAQNFAGSLWSQISTSDDICNEDAKGDFWKIQCAAIQTSASYSFSGMNAATIDSRNEDQLRNMHEELVFLEAARRTHQFTTCQVAMFNRLESDTDLMADYTDLAFREFEVIQAEVATEVAARDISQTIADSHVFDPMDRRVGISSRNAEAGFDPQERRRDANRRDAKLRDLISRMPLGNRPEVKDAIENLTKRNGTITRQTFGEIYEAAITTLRAQAIRSNQTFSPPPTGIYHQREVGGETRDYYSVDEDFKKQLVQTGQISNIVEDLGLSEQLQTGFLCHVRQRYVTGPIAFEVAQIPLYFTGYGVARLGARGLVAGASRLATYVNKSGRLVSGSARGAMYGLEAADIGQMADSLRSCISQRPLLVGRQQNGSCDPETEVFNAYHEASLSQCATEGLIAGASLGIPAVVAIRSAALRRIVNANNPAPARAAASPGSNSPPQEIVVTANADDALPPAALAGDDYDRAWERLQRNGVTTENASSVVLTSRQQRRFNQRERIAFFEQVSPGETLNANQLDAFDELIYNSNRSSDWLEARPEQLRQFLRETGVASDKVEETTQTLLRSNIFGGPAARENPVVVGNVTNNLHEVWLRGHRSRGGGVREKPIPLQAGETAEQGLARLEGEGFSNGVRINEDGILVQDINQSAANLVPALNQKLNGAPSPEYVEIVYEKQFESLNDFEDAAAEIHNVWLSHNSWAPDNLRVPFRELSAEEKLKDLDVLDAILETRNPSLLSNPDYRRYRETLESLASSSTPTPTINGALATNMNVQDAVTSVEGAWAKTQRYLRRNNIEVTPDNQQEVTFIFDQFLSRQVTPTGPLRAQRRDNGVRIVDAAALAPSVNSNQIPDFIARRVTVDHHDMFGQDLPFGTNSTTQILDMLAPNSGTSAAEFNQFFRNFASDNIGDAYGLARFVVQNADVIRTNPQLRERLRKLAVQEDFQIFGLDSAVQTDDQLAAVLRLNDRTLPGVQNTFMDRIDLNFNAQTSENLDAMQRDLQRVLLPQNQADRDFAAALATDFRQAIGNNAEALGRGRIPVSVADQEVPILLANVSEVKNGARGPFEEWSVIPDYVRSAEASGSQPIQRTFTFNGEDTAATRNFVFSNFSGRGSNMFEAPSAGGDAFIAVLSRAEATAIRKRISENALNSEQLAQANQVLEQIDSGAWRPQNRPDGSLLFGQTYMKTEEISAFVRQDETLRSLGVDIPVGSSTSTPPPARHGRQRSWNYHGSRNPAVRNF